ncbi:C40 family peptidase [Streptomyces polygonati]|uniref:C40 family peptidase n=1 Tax=Streptomyces polygonati TaxID=1617087 RepID=A0ABV8HLI6_9ACTN
MSVARWSGRRHRPALACGALLATAALALPAAGPATARPADQRPAPAVPIAGLLAQLQSSYRRTETATEAYDRAGQSAARQRAAADAADRRLADQRVAVAEARDELGTIAREMYRTGGVSPLMSLLTGPSPQAFFTQRHIARRAASHQRDVLHRLSERAARLEALNTAAQRALDAAQRAQQTLAVRKKQVETRLRQVEATLAGLTPAQIDQLQALEQQGSDQAQRDFMDAKPLGDAPATRAPSAAGERALGYAFAQLGKPYAWGAAGPDSFDCSGLTSRAWAHAGRAIPRTSEQQWAELPRVPMASLRPGDLVVYFQGATHVALYIGGGRVIEAPRPGATVQVSPLAADPVLGAVRPDPREQPLEHYRPRPVPASADRPPPITATAPAPPRVPDPGSP